MRGVAGTTASVIAVLVTAAFLPSSGFGSSSAAAARGAQRIPAGLAAAIHSRLGARAIRSSSTLPGFLGDPLLGTSVSLSADGTTALVGAPGVAGGKGAAYIFHTSDAGSWSSSVIPTATLTKHRAVLRPNFGRAVALSADGTTAFVGAPVDSDFYGPGAMYVFHVSAEDAWASSSTPTATLTITGSTYLGSALAVSTDGTTLLVGAPAYNNFAGAAYVFHVSSEGAWASTSTPTATLTPNGATGDVAGADVAISGDGTTALISDSANGGGGAALFRVADASAWTSTSTATAILTDANYAVPDDDLGWSVALSADGTVALLGAPGVSSYAGAVDVFHASGEAAWATTSTPTATLTVAGGAHNFLGGDLAVSTDGATALLSAYSANAYRGAAYIFRASSGGGWASSSTPTATLAHSAGHAGDWLAVATVLTPDGTTAFVGAPGVRSMTGAADIFHASDASSWATSSTPKAILTDDALAHCVVPKLKGLKLGIAKHALSVGRCRLGKLMRVYPPVRRGRVVSQSRRPGRRLAIAAKISITIGK